MDASGQIFIIGWKIALPVFLATFIIELAFGYIARMQPQINNMVVTAPLKILVGLIVLGASLAFMPRAMGDVMNLMVLKK
jgi:flagellar biosynthetic protein FliR